MKTLNRKELLGLKVDVPRETVEVPEWKRSVILRGMTGAEQTKLYKSAQKKGEGVDEETFTARLIAACLVDDNGERLLEDGEFSVVMSWPGQVFQRLAQVAMRLNGLGDRGN